MKDLEKALREKLEKDLGKGSKDWLDEHLIIDMPDTKILVYDTKKDWPEGHSIIDLPDTKKDK